MRHSFENALEYNFPVYASLNIKQRAAVLRDFLLLLLDEDFPSIGDAAAAYRERIGRDNIESYALTMLAHYPDHDSRKVIESEANANSQG